ncbi:hypothetical protein AcV7_007562 [Taiwanofungus camphoratus]|nr:hypothetical protein AcV7_007562 [Antrodia cinnamomea]
MILARFIRSRLGYTILSTTMRPLYHQAAVFHKFLSPRLSLEAAKLSESRRGGWLNDVRTWKELCRRWLTLERNWNGRGQVLEGGYSTPDDGVLRFQIDEEQNTVIEASRSGGLTVHAMEDHRVLWGLSKDYPFRSRCELSHGFLVFTNKSGLEIWRRSADVEANPGLHINGRIVSTPIREPSSSAAVEFQFAEARLSLQRSLIYQTSDVSQSLRGQYTPHAYFRKPLVDTVGLFRFRFPDVVLMDHYDRNAVLLLDVCEGVVLRRIALNMQSIVGAPIGFVLPPPSDRVVMDLDVTDDYISICMDFGVLFVPRRKSDEAAGPDAELLEQSDGDETSKMLVLTEDLPPQSLQASAMQLSKINRSSQLAPAFEVETLPGGSMTCVTGLDALEQFEVVPRAESAAAAANDRAIVPTGFRIMRSYYVSARFSPDGRHVAVGTAFGLLYIVSDFRRVARGTFTFTEISKRIYMKEAVRDLIWEEQQRRLALQTASEEIFIFNLDLSYHCERPVLEAIGAIPHQPSDPFPNMTVFHLSDFTSTRLGWARVGGVAFSGMQMTRTALWMVWDLALIRYAMQQRELRGTQDWDDSREEEDAVGDTGFCHATGNASVCFIRFTAGI